MALIDNLKDAVRAVPEPDLTGYAFIVATQAQVDAMKADTYRADAPDVALYRPDGTRASRAAPHTRPRPAERHVSKAVFVVILIATTTWWLFHPTACFLPWACF
jgi:hypothetical protein